MFVLVQQSEYASHQTLLGKMFELRERIVPDDHGQNAPFDARDGRDRFDDIGPAYLIWCDGGYEVLYGSLRLLPTTGPTRAGDVSRRICLPDLDLCHPSIWEGTHLCIDAAAIEADMPEIGPSAAVVHMLVALAECALAEGISALVTDYEPQLASVFLQTGAPLSEVGRIGDGGSRPVCCGLFGIDRVVVDTMHANTGLSGLYCSGPRRSLPETPPMFEHALEDEKLRTSNIN